MLDDHQCPKSHDKARTDRPDQARRILQQWPPEARDAMTGWKFTASAVNTSPDYAGCMATDALLPFACFSIMRTACQ